MAAPMKMSMGPLRAQLFPLFGVVKRNNFAKESVSVLKYGCITCRKDRTFATGRKTSTLRCYESRQVDVTSGKSTFSFDTHAAVKKLQDSGMTLPQAEALVDLISQISQANMENVNKNLVSKPQQEILLQQIMSHISSVKKDMIILEKSEFSSLKHEYEKQHMELKNLQQQLMDETSKLKSSVTLDLNLERARAKEAHLANEVKLGDLHNKMEMQHLGNDKQDSLLDNKIDKEIANLLATYERYRNDLMKYAAGTIMTCIGLGLGVYRIWAK